MNILKAPVPQGALEEHVGLVGEQSCAGRSQPMGQEKERPRRSGARGTVDFPATAGAQGGSIPRVSALSRAGRPPESRPKGPRNQSGWVNSKLLLTPGSSAQLRLPPGRGQIPWNPRASGSASSCPRWTFSPQGGRRLSRGLSIPGYPPGVFRPFQGLHRGPCGAQLYLARAQPICCSRQLYPILL